MDDAELIKLVDKGRDGLLDKYEQNCLAFEVLRLLIDKKELRREVGSCRTKIQALYP